MQTSIETYQRDLAFLQNLLAKKPEDKKLLIANCREIMEQIIFNITHPQYQNLQERLPELILRFLKLKQHLELQPKLVKEREANIANIEQRIRELTPPSTTLNM